MLYSDGIGAGEKVPLCLDLAGHSSKREKEENSKNRHYTECGQRARAEEISTLLRRSKKVPHSMDIPTMPQN